jgi:hypothetical protein
MDRYKTIKGPCAMERVCLSPARADKLTFVYGRTRRGAADHVRVRQSEEPEPGRAMAAPGKAATAKGMTAKAAMTTKAATTEAATTEAATTKGTAAKAATAKAATTKALTTKAAAEVTKKAEEKK